MSWTSRSQPIKVGDQVAYSRRFLQSIGQYTGDMPFGRGTVTALQPVGGITLAVIDWGGADLPQKVNVKHLSPVRDGQVMDID